MHTWVIGSGGLFGSALSRASESTFRCTPIPWSNNHQARETLQQSLRIFAARTTGDWCVAWAAGHATTSSTQAAADRELELFTSFIQALQQEHPSGNGVFLLTSSAGGVYAGTPDPPFTSTSVPQPLGIYGQLKLAQEEAARQLTPSIPVAIARVSNLYGPGQDLGKLQGVISRLALAAVTRDPITMFVPLDTMRDYIHTDDAAVRALHWARMSLATQRSAIRVVASGQSETLSHIIALMNSITRVRIPVASGLHESARVQASDLRLRPDTDQAIDRLPLTPLPVGMKQVFLDIRRRHANAKLAG